MSVVRLRQDNFRCLFWPPDRCRIPHLVKLAENFILTVLERWLPVFLHVTKEMYNVDKQHFFKIPVCQTGIDVFILNFSEAFSAYLVCQYVGIGGMTLRKGNTEEGRT